MPEQPSHPVTLAGFDKVLAVSSVGEIFCNRFAATMDRCWFSVHINLGPGSASDAFSDLQLWNEESLVEFKSRGVGEYDLQLLVDGAPTRLEFSDGTGGGRDERGRIRWTQNLSFPISLGQSWATLDLTWPRVTLFGSHKIDFRVVAQMARAGSY